MTRIEITDAMVKRAAEALRGVRPLGEEMNSARRILDAALNPPLPPEPLPHITPAMFKAGEAALRGRLAYEIKVDVMALVCQPQTAVADVYRAMYTAAFAGPQSIVYAHIRGVTVTTEMLAAGYKAYNARPGSPDQFDCLMEAYCAMAALDPSLKSPRVPLLVCAKCGSTHVEEERRIGTGRRGAMYETKRKGDPR